MWTSLASAGCVRPPSEIGISTRQPPVSLPEQTPPIPHSTMFVPLVAKPEQVPARRPRQQASGALAPVQVSFRVGRWQVAPVLVPALQDGPSDVGVQSVRSRRRIWPGSGLSARSRPQLPFDAVSKVRLTK